MDHPYIEFTATPPFIRFHWPIGLQRYDDKMEQMKWVLEECEYELAHAISVAEKTRWNQRIKRVRKAKEQLLEEAALDAKTARSKWGRFSKRLQRQSTMSILYVASRRWV